MEISIPKIENTSLLLKNTSTLQYNSKTFMASFHGENFVKYSTDRKKQVHYTVKSVTNNNSF